VFVNTFKHNKRDYVKNWQYKVIITTLGLESRPQRQLPLFRDIDFVEEVSLLAFSLQGFHVPQSIAIAQMAIAFFWL